MKRDLLALVAVVFAVGCGDESFSDEPLVGPVVSPMSPSSGVINAPPSRPANGMAAAHAGTSTALDNSRMFWDPAKAAFRAGRVSGVAWDDANVGILSVAMGNNTLASGQYATAMGLGAKASGRSSTARGEGAEASGKYATAMGYHNTAQAAFSVALGRFNVIEGDVTEWVPADPLFVIGNGADNANRNNALEVLKNGNTTINGDLTLMGKVNGSLDVTGSVNVPQICLAGVCRTSWPSDPSDENLKQNIRPINDALEKISQLAGVAYDWRTDVREAEVHPGPQIGVLGQEVEAVFPELVGTDSRGYKYVRYQKLVAPLIEAVKELKAKSEERELENQQLRALVADLASTVQRLESAVAASER